MKSKPVPKFLLELAVALLLVLLLAGLALASGEQILWQVLSGGGQESGGSFALQSALGQTTTGNSSGGGFTLCSGFNCGPSGGPQGPTSVMITVFQIRSQSEGVLIQWETGNEIELIGFNLYCSPTSVGEKRRLNQGMIPSATPGQISGYDYSYLDTSAQPGQVVYYWLEVLVKGARQWIGPEMVTTGFYLHLPLILR